MDKKYLQKALLCSLISVMTVGMGVGVVQSNQVDVGIAVEAASITKGNYIYTKLSDGSVEFQGYAPATYNDTTGEEIVHAPTGSTVTIPSKIDGMLVTVIGKIDGVSDYVYDYTKVVIPSSVKVIKNEAFKGWGNLTTVDFSKATSLTSIGSSAFSETGVNSISLPSTVKTIGSEAFKDCSDLSKVTLPKGLTTIGNSAFENCYSLSTVNLQDLTSLQAIPEKAFYSTALSDITIPDSVLVIKDEAFGSIRTAEDIYGDSVAAKLTFKTASSTKIKIAQSAFNYTELDTVKIPSNAYNTTVGTISASTFSDANRLIVTNSSQKVTDIDSTGINSLQIPYGSYIWVGMYLSDSKYDDDKKLSYIKEKSDVQEVNNFTLSDDNVKVTGVKLSEGSNFTVSYDPVVNVTDSGAKNVVLTAKLGYCNVVLNKISDYKRFFVYNDSKGASSGKFTLTNKTNSSGKLTSYLQLSKDITKEYKVQAEKFENAVVTFDTSKDAKSGIYNSKYKTYVSNSDTEAVKPTVIVTLNGKVVNNKYYTVKYSDNVGLTGKAAVTVTVNSAGSKLYSSGSVKKSFSVKRDISKVGVTAVGTIKQGEKDTGTNAMYADSAKSAFLPVTDENYKISKSKYRVKAEISGVSKSFTAGNKESFDVVYDEYSFTETATGVVSNVSLGEVTCTLSARSTSPYFFGTREIRYLTKYNISNFKSVALKDGESEYDVTYKNDTANKGMYYGTEFVYRAKAIKPMVLLSEGGSQSELVADSALTYSYTNNVNASKDGTKANLARVTVSVNSNNCSYLYGARTIYFKINRCPLNGQMFSAINVYTYTGSPIKPTVSVTGSVYKPVLNKDFTLSYSNNTNAGTATVNITSIAGSNYSGSTSKKFTINKASMSKAKISFVDSNSTNIVSFRFGLDIKPVVVVKYGGVTLKKDTDYAVTYIGEKVNGSYTGTAPYKTSQEGGVVITPLSTSKNFLSAANDSAMSTHTYAKSNKVAGILRNYTVDALTLDHVNISYNNQLESYLLNYFRENLIPNITVNGQTLKPYKPTEVRSTLVSEMQKADPKKTLNECRVAVNKMLPEKVQNYRGVYDYVRGYYGSYVKDSKTGYLTSFKLSGIIVRNTDEVNGDYWDLRDDFIMVNSKVNNSRWVVATFCYSTDVVDTKNGYKGLKLRTKTYKFNGVTYNDKIVAPGNHHIYTMNNYVTGYTAGLDKSKIWDINIGPSRPQVTIEGYEVDREPGKTKIQFTPSSSDEFDGKTYYTLNFYKTKSDASKNINAIKSVVMTYNHNKPSVTTYGLVRSTELRPPFNDPAYQYTYDVSGLDYGRSYFVTVTATDSSTEVSSLPSSPEAFMSSTTIATIDYIKYTQNGQNFNVTAKINQPPTKLDDDGGEIANIYYVVSIYTTNGEFVKSYKVDKKGREGYKKIANDGTVSFGNVPGLKATGEYYATIETYLAYNTGVFTDTTYPVKCVYTKLSDTFVGLTNNLATYKLTNTNKFASSIKLDKSTVNSGSVITLTANVGISGSKSGSAPYVYTYEILNSAGSLVGSSVKHTNISKTSDSYKFTTSATGTFRARVTVTDKNGVSTSSIQYFTVVEKLENTSSFISASTIPVDSNLTINLSSKGGYTNGHIKYTVKLKSPSGKTTTLLTDSLNTTLMIDSVNNAEIGDYVITVVASDSTGGRASKELKYKVTKTFINTSSLQTENPSVNDGLEILLSSSGATSDVTYTVSYAKYNTSTKKYDTYVTPKKTESIVLGKGKTSSVILPLPSAGKFKIRIQAKMGNKIETATYYVEASYAELINNSELDKTIMSTADSVTISPKSTGGQGTVKYSVSYANVKSTDQYKSVTTKDSKGNYTLKGLSAGDYVIKVVAMDSKNVEISKELYVSVKAASSFAKDIKLIVNGQTISDKAEVFKGATISINSTLNTGVSVVYQYKRSTNTSWKNMTTASSMGYFKPTEAASYDIRAIYTDTSGVKVTKYFSVTTIEPTKIRSSVAVKSGSTVITENPIIEIGSPMALVPKTVDGVTVTYAYKLRESSSWSSMTLSPSGKSASVTPSKIGTYDLRIIYTKGSKTYSELFTVVVK